MHIDLTEYRIKQRLAEVRALTDQIDQCFQQEVERLGFDDASVRLQPAAKADYYLEKDPASGEYTLVGDWLDKRGYKEGTLVFHADGSFFVEQNVVQPHPRKKKWFVEAINAWGKGDEIKAEARLMPMPG